MRLDDWLANTLITADVHTTLGACRARLAEHRIRHLPLTRDGRLVGVLTDVDLHGDEPDEVPAEALQPSSPTTATLEEAPSYVIARLARSPQDAVVVVDAAHRPIGILTEADLVARAADLLPPTRTVEEVASTSLYTVAPDATVAHAKDEMRHAWVRHLLVVQGQRLVGVVSWRDLAHASPGRRVDGCLTAERPEVVHWSTPLRDAAARMRAARIGALPVVDHDEPSLVHGIVTRTDIVRALGAAVGPSVTTR